MQATLMDRRKYLLKDYNKVQTCMLILELHCQEM